MDMGLILCYHIVMKFKDIENRKTVGSFVGFCFLVVGLILQNYIWLVAAIAMKIGTISIVVYHEHSHKKIAPKSKNEEILDELRRYNILKKKR